MSSQGTSSPTAPTFTCPAQAPTSRKTTKTPATPTQAQPASTADCNSSGSRSTTATESGIFQQSEEEDDQSTWPCQQHYFNINNNSDDDTQAPDVSARPGLQQLSFESYHTDSDIEAAIPYQAQQPTPEAAGPDVIPRDSTIDAMDDLPRGDEEWAQVRDTAAESQEASDTSLELPLTVNGHACNIRSIQIPNPNPGHASNITSAVGSAHQQVLDSWRTIFN
jgi:hypothetical protein